jgi:hypothetical protein
MSKQGWEPEPHDPREFGMTAWWLPQNIFGEHGVGFMGLYQWRKRFNTVEKVVRSSLMVRDTGGGEPFVIVCDDIKQDDEIREYCWRMTTKPDVKLVSFNGKEAILAGTDGSGSQQLIVRLLSSVSSTMHGDVRCEFETFHKPDHKQKRLPDGSMVQLPMGRMMFKVRAKSAQFKIAFFALPRSGQSPPTTVWNDDGTRLCVISCDADKKPITTVVQFSVGQVVGETAMTVFDAECMSTVSYPDKS